MDQLLSGKLIPKESAQKAFVNLSLADLTELCSVSTELKTQIGNEEFWKLKVQHDYPLLKLVTVPDGFETWNEFLVHRVDLRRTLKSLFYRFKNLSVPSEEEFEDFDDRFERSPRLYIDGFNSEYDPSKYNYGLSITRVDDGVDVLLDVPGYPDNEGFLLSELDDRIDRYLDIVDTYHVSEVGLDTRKGSLVHLKFLERLGVDFED